ncbi:hypothetical protein ACFFTM_00975 [Pseudoduganella plicata]|uniref:Uncharacterized protein n=1 Tax=Pseudoduganella plicata TaxID=321984 RepID=A0A4P7BEC4_9BURK|nr:hypothetical protein [Pseudoduganella plicata]QBQ36600.1 hypothetical protein E1742_10820 [Pseudoduganella plicata]GGY74088.1 hypothetical protein GCM10007388_03050 [Pseudoduganella plicata]
MKCHALALLAAGTQPVATPCHACTACRIGHLEPACWWTGMQQGRDVAAGTVHRLEGTVKLPACSALLLECQ